MAVRYFAPAGLGTSGSGLSRSNPIYGLSDMSMVQSGDEIVLLPGTYYEQFIIPVDNLKLYSEEAIFDGTSSLNGSFSCNSSHQIITNAPWVLDTTDISKNIWKKGCQSANMLFIDNNYCQPLESQNLTNSVATIVASLQDFQYTLRTETLHGVGVTIYIKLPSGFTPSNFDIRRTHRLGGTDYVGGLVEAVGKNNISFETEFFARRTAPSNGKMSPFYFENCNNIQTKDLLRSEYFHDGVYIIGGDSISVKTHGKFSVNPSVQIAAAKPISGGTVYNAGSIEVRDWYAESCGTLVTFSGGLLNYGDADGGVGVGYFGGNINKVIIRDGTSQFCGPRYTVKPSWMGAVPLKGSSIFVGTSYQMVINSLEIYRNVSINDTKQGINIENNANNSFGSIKVTGNVIKDCRRPAKTENNTETGVLNVKLGGTAQTAITIDICNNTVIGGTHSSSIIETRTAGTGQAANCNFNICNNVFSGITLHSDYTTNRGNIWLRDPINGTKNVNYNISDNVSSVYGMSVTTTYANLAAWQAAGFDTNGQQGTVTVNNDYSLTAGTANPISTGVKYWGNNPRPTSLNNEPLPDTSIDIGAYQTTSSPYHPSNL